MVVFRGVNIYPGQIMDVICQFAELGGEYQAEITRDAHAQDHMLLTVERAMGQSAANDENLAAAIASKLRKAILARMDVKIADYGSLPRTFSKSKRVTDLRHTQTK